MMYFLKSLLHILLIFLFSINNASSTEVVVIACKYIDPLSGSVANYIANRVEIGPGCIKLTSFPNPALWFRVYTTDEIDANIGTIVRQLNDKQTELNNLQSKYNRLNNSVDEIVKRLEELELKSKK